MVTLERMEFKNPPIASGDSSEVPSWIKTSKRSWLEHLFIRILQAGPIPKHVAFIMDGNRRFARRLNKEPIEGHVKGFEKLSETLQWCKDIGITEVTIYAFSIENFKRSKSEVEGLLLLAEEKVKLLLEEKDKLVNNGICIRIIGNLALLPERLRNLIDEVKRSVPKDEDAKLFLNVCLSYTSHDEMCHALKTLIADVQNNRLDESEINEEEFEKRLMIKSKPDLLVRTSGEQRLSDFLLWQASSTYLYFANVLWPNFTIWHLFWGVFLYQRHCAEQVQ